METTVEQSGVTKRIFLWVKRKDITDGQGVLYLRRWILTPPIFGYQLFLHQIVRPDHDRCLHDHPWGFIGLILWGGYVEDLKDGTRRTNKPWRVINRLNPTFTHRIHSLLNGKSSWTLLVRGPFKREWGFYTPSGWMSWRAFLAIAEKTRVLWCGTEK
jgi:hypothetical protein